MEEERILLRSRKAIATQRLLNYATSARALAPRKRSTGRRDKAVSRRKWVVAQDNNEVDEVKAVDDSNDDTTVEDIQPPPADAIAPITTPPPFPAVMTVTVTASVATVTEKQDHHHTEDDHEDDDNDDDTTAATTVVQVTQTAQPATQATNSPTIPSTLSNDHHSGPSALQTGGEKAGLVVGMTVGVSVILFLIFFLILRRKYAPDYTIWSCITRRRKRSSPKESFGFGNNHKWFTLPDGEEAGTGWNNKIKARRVTTTVKEMDGGSFENFLRKPSVRSLPREEHDLESNTAEETEKAATVYEDEKTIHPTPRLTIGTQSSASWRTENERELHNIMQEMETETEPEPSRRGHDSGLAPSHANKIRRPGMSYFSWSTAPTTPASVLMTPRGNNRETIMTDDSEPPRFRTINSWVNNQSTRQQQQLLNMDLVPPPIFESSGKRYDHPPYPPTPPIPHRHEMTSFMSQSLAEEKGERPTSFLASPSLESDGGRRLFQPVRAATKPSSTQHNRMRSSATASTLLVFRQHPGEEVHMGESQVGRIRSSSLRRLMGQ